MGPSIGMVSLVKGLPCLILLNTCWMRSCENSVLSLRLGWRFVRLAGPAQAAKKLLRSLAADMHHIGIIRDLAQNRCYRAQLLGIMIGPYVFQLLQPGMHAQLVEAVLKTRLAAVIEGIGNGHKEAAQLLSIGILRPVVTGRAMLAC